MAHHHGDPSGGGFMGGAMGSMLAIILIALVAVVLLFVIFAWQPWGTEGTPGFDAPDEPNGIETPTVPDGNGNDGDAAPQSFHFADPGYRLIA